MVDTQRFESLLEALDNEIEDLPEGSVKHNLEDIHSGLYGIFEDVSLVEFEKTSEENTILKELLADRLTYDDKLYYRIKYNIDLGV